MSDGEEVCEEKTDWGSGGWGGVIASLREVTSEGRV